MIGLHRAPPRRARRSHPGRGARPAGAGRVRSRRSAGPDAPPRARRSTCTPHITCQAESYLAGAAPGTGAPAGPRAAPSSSGGTGTSRTFRGALPRGASPHHV